MTSFMRASQAGVQMSSAWPASFFLHAMHLDTKLPFSVSCQETGMETSAQHRTASHVSQPLHSTAATPQHSTAQHRVTRLTAVTQHSTGVPSSALSHSPQVPAPPCPAPLAPGSSTAQHSRYTAQHSTAVTQHSTVQHSTTQPLHRSASQ